MWDLDISNIAGIRSGRATLERGVNVVQADNWQGKTSLLAAVRTVVGTTALAPTGHPLTEGATEGRVTLDTGAATHVTRLQRGEAGAVTRSGDTYLTEETDRVCARLFAFLGESNPVRAAVRNGDDLAALLHCPLDIADIDAQIEELTAERRRVVDALDRAEAAAREVSAVRETVASLEADLESLRERRAALTAETGDDGTAADLRDRLRDRRTELDRIESDVERLENKTERQADQLADKRAELADLSVPAEPDPDRDIEQSRARIRTLETEIGLLENLYSANKRVLDENRTDLVADLDRGIAADEFACWVCGESTTASTVSEKLAALQAEIETRRSERNDLEDTISTLRERREAAASKRQTRDRLESTIADLEADLEVDRQDLANTRERRDNLVGEIEELEARLAEVSDSATADLASVESEITITERELGERREELDDLEARSERRADLETSLEELETEIESLRERKRNTQRELKVSFDAAMETVIERFDPGFERARLDPKLGPDGEVTRYDLVVAREGREVPRRALSEGEVELLGIVTALAGYETFEVAERVPVLTLDGIGQLTSSHLQALIAFLRDRTEILVTTADPDAGPIDGHTLTPADWQVVSDERPTPS